MNAKMTYKKNTLTGDYLCTIPGTSQAYAVVTEKHAKGFCEKINDMFEKGELIVENGEVKECLKK